MILYDTCSLLNHFNEILQKKEKFAVSSITINELENIKISANKDFDVKEKASNITRWFFNNDDKYENILYQTKWDKILSKHNYLIENDSRIFATAYYNKNLTFITDDHNCKALAKALGVKTEVFKSNVKDEYHGYKIISTDEELELFYDREMYAQNNVWDLKGNEYLLIKKDNKILDKYKWSGGYQKVDYVKCKSTYFGDLKPKDAYQQCALDSFNHNKITLIGGPAGSGKTLLALSFLFDKMEHGIIDRIVIFCNPAAAKNAVKLGFYPGTREEKILGTQVGGILSSKLGGMMMVEKLIAEEKIVLIPAADARGYETPANSGVYIIEAQNLDKVLMKTILQRIGENCITIIDGDRTAQTDMAIYAGNNNGMKRMSEVFRGQECFGQMDLECIYRSEIANIADKI